MATVIVHVRPTLTVGFVTADPRAIIRNLNPRAILPGDWS